jgi:hypothetical protein
MEVDITVAVDVEGTQAVVRRQRPAAAAERVGRIPTAQALALVTRARWIHTRIAAALSLAVVQWIAKRTTWVAPSETITLVPAGATWQKARCSATLRLAQIQRIAEVIAF